MFPNDDILEMKKKSVVARDWGGLGVEGSGGCVTNRQREGPCGDGNVQGLDPDGGFKYRWESLSNVHEMYPQSTSFHWLWFGATVLQNVTTEPIWVQCI